jgi:hypothetical protein
MKRLTIGLSILMILVFIGFVVSNLKSSDRYSKKEINTVSNILNLNIDLETIDITIEFSDVTTPTFVYSESLNKNIGISQDDFTVSLREQKSFFSFGNSKTNTIQVKLPYNYKLENLKANLNLSDLKLKDLVIENINANLSQGDLLIINSEISNSRFKLEIGDVKIRDSQISKIDIENDMGDIILINTQKNDTNFKNNSGVIIEK